MASSLSLRQTVVDRQDAWFLRLAGRGDEQALVALYERYGGLARRRALVALRDRRLAEDAVHDAFVDLWRTADEFDPGRTTVVVWLCVLVERRVVGLARREARRRVGDERVREPEPGSQTAEELAVLRYERPQALEAIAQARARQARVVDIAAYRQVAAGRLGAVSGPEAA